MIQPHSFTFVFFDTASSRSNLRSILPDGLLGIASMTLTPPRSLLWLATRSETHAAIAVSTVFLPLPLAERTTEISPFNVHHTTKFIRFTVCSGNFRCLLIIIYTNYSSIFYVCMLEQKILQFYSVQLKVHDGTISRNSPAGGTYFGI